MSVLIFLFCFVFSATAYPTGIHICFVECFKDCGGRLVTKRGAVLTVWEGYLKELSNREGSNGELELPCYVDGKVELVAITEDEGVHQALD